MFFIFDFLNIHKFTLKINDWPKVQICFSNISARKYPSKMVQYSKRTFRCQVSNESDPNYGSFLFLKKSNRNHGAIILKQFKGLHRCFCLIFPKTKGSHSWVHSHLKPDIKRSVLSAEPFLRDFFGPRYLRNNSKLLVNNQFSM